LDPKRVEQCLHHAGDNFAPNSLGAAVDNFVAARASEFHKAQQVSLDFDRSALNSIVWKCGVFNNFGEKASSGSGAMGWIFVSTIESII
jgi:hypothetical protein